MQCGVRDVVIISQYTFGIGTYVVAMGCALRFAVVTRHVAPGPTAQVLRGLSFSKPAGLVALWSADTRKGGPSGAGAHNPNAP